MPSKDGALRDGAGGVARTEALDGEAALTCSRVVSDGVVRWCLSWGLDVRLSGPRGPGVWVGVGRVVAPASSPQGDRKATVPSRLGISPGSQGLTQSSCCSHRVEFILGDGWEVGVPVPSCGSGPHFHKSLPHLGGAGIWSGGGWP